MDELAAPTNVLDFSVSITPPNRKAPPMNRCEDYPCCGHELGDCDGSLYGSDEAIKERVYAQMRDYDYDPEVDDPQLW